MLTIPKCYSALVASGNGAKCNELKKKINSVLMNKENNTGLLKVTIFKYYKEEFPDIAKLISHELKQTIDEVVCNVDNIYFGNDLNKRKSISK